MESLGDKVKTISLVKSRYILLCLLAFGGAGLILFLVNPGSGLGNESLGICFVPVAVVMAIVGVVLLFQIFSQLSVSLYQQGLVIKRLLGIDTIRWDDVGEISCFNLIYVRRDRGFPLPVIFPGVLILIGVLRIGAGTSRIFESTYVFKLRDGRKITLIHNARLFELAKPILEGTFPFLVRETAQRLRRGEDISLHERISYSLSGLKGSIVKGTHGRKRQVPFEISWRQYSGYTMDEDRLVLKSEKKPLTTLAPIEVKNLHVFSYLAPVLKRGDSEKLARLADGTFDLQGQNNSKPSESGEGSPCQS